MSERERFEAWAIKEVGGNNRVLDKVNGMYIHPFARKFWTVWQAACPDGYQCVPKELDEGMTESVMWAVDESRLQGMWTDLLSAAPKPGEL